MFGQRTARARPWLVTDGTHQIAFYSFLATLQSSPSSIADAFVVFRSDDGGETWTPTSDPVVPGGSIDKSSLAVNSDGTELHLAFVRPGIGVFTTSSFDGGASWEAEVHVDGSGLDSQSPIIHVDPSNDDLVLVSYQDGSSISFAGSWDRAASWAHWATVATTSGLVAPQADMGNTMRNLVFHSFDIDPVTLHCVIAFEDSGSVFFTSSSDGASWSSPVAVAPPETVTEIQFQPTVAAGYEGVAIAYYYQEPTGDTFVHGVVSPDHGFSWNSPEVLNTDSGGAPEPFLPCVTQQRYFGDYIGVTAIGLGDGGGGRVPILCDLGRRPPRLRAEWSRENRQAPALRRGDVPMTRLRPVVLAQFLFAVSAAGCGEHHVGEPPEERIACDDPRCSSHHQCCTDYETGERYCCSGFCNTHEEYCYCVEGSPPCNHETYCCPRWELFGESGPCVDDLVRTYACQETGP